MKADVTANAQPEVEVDLEDYFDCPRLKARMKLKSCEVNRTANRRLKTGAKYSMPGPCKDCEGWSGFGPIIKAEQFEGQVFQQMRENNPLTTLELSNLHRETNSFKRIRWLK